MQKKFKITLIHSPEDYYDQNYGTRFIPLWAYYLASYIPENWEVKIVDCRMADFKSIEEANVFAYSGINQDLPKINEVNQHLTKNFPDSIHILGGPITWSFQKEEKLDLLEHFNFLFILDGEKALPEFLNAYENNSLNSYPYITENPRYAFSDAKPIAFDLIDQSINQYYGAVIEVSRGCPFLCEFCDIRVIPDNNRSHTKEIEVIIQELDQFYKRGVNKFQFACDNFIGDIQWAEKCVDAILEWKEKTGANISLFTWLTINLYKMPGLMKKMRQCGFSVIFIGIESVNQNSLLETAKVQNIKVLKQAVETIQSYGFIIAPGFIFGFDSDTEDIFEQTLSFLSDTGIVGGDPSFLTALAGTPLYDRMKRSQRLIERSNFIERNKIQTNIYYLMSAEKMTKGFIHFVNGFTESHFQLKRFKRNIQTMLENPDNYCPIDSSGYATPSTYIFKQIRQPEYFKMLFRRVLYVSRPDRALAIIRAWMIVLRNRKGHPSFSTNFFYWLYTWTNMALKYDGLKPSDFHLLSVDDHFDRSIVLQSFEDTIDEAALAESEGVKANNQRRYTRKALEQLSQDIEEENISIHS